MEELNKQIYVKSELLVCCRNRMCVTDNEEELVRMYVSLNSYANELYRLNYRRLHNEF